MSQVSGPTAKTYYFIPDDKAEFKCYECGRLGRADRVKFVKITGLFGARHADCVEDLSEMTEIPYPEKGFWP